MDSKATKTTDKYDAYVCTKCGGSGFRKNDAWEQIGQPNRVLCFCDGFGVVLVLHGYSAPWYAGERIERKVEP